MGCVCWRSELAGRMGGSLCAGLPRMRSGGWMDACAQQADGFRGPAMHWGFNSTREEVKMSASAMRHLQRGVKHALAPPSCAALCGCRPSIGPCWLAACAAAPPPAAPPTSAALICRCARPACRRVPAGVPAASLQDAGPHTLPSRRPVQGCMGSWQEAGSPHIGRTMHSNHGAIALSWHTSSTPCIARLRPARVYPCADPPYATSPVDRCAARRSARPRT